MVFSSPIFLFFYLPVVLAFYLATPSKLRNVVLLLASLFFYAWGETFYVVLMLVSIAMNYGFGLWVDRTRETPNAGKILGLAVVANLGLLAWFKYGNFLTTNLNLLLTRSPNHPFLVSRIHLPIGISFFTFQALSYVIDVHRNSAPVQKNPFNVALYISLFPQLIAGPIVRFGDVAQEITERKVSIADFSSGVQRFILGLGKKVLIADIVGSAADGIYSLPIDQVTQAMACLAVLSYTLQIYFDFSGYSDMAIGLGRMFGFHFLENFNYPYISRSLTEFWRRWHISLSTWFRDYLYIPLGGNRLSPAKTYRNLVMVFFLCGLWHGASWNFVVWGLYHGFFLVIERILRGFSLPRPLAPLGWLYAFLVVVVGWVFFRIEDFAQAVAILQIIVGLGPEAPGNYDVLMFCDREFLYALAAGVVGCLPIFPAVSGWHRDWRNKPGRSSWIIAGSASALYTVLLMIILIAVAMQFTASTYSPFIYFRF